ncbi:4-hydroxythreonine-4-phosphate dehydrogenase [Helicobacter sp. MIT 21-1697]|uniref:4-hydroxythreonine-4-phosphate dehydrogenase n=1 Tax=Helicobacter sp. MIT 21-1697 TaxID=2993733 RepID=UPI00224A4EDF|nr:4-hydroxythreonine-4-phosphate dehydrogenase [Helicobacter sp. MIT 21-1697]MCX2716937.1 4-hydroxythreonine-4-phosphate dehydrogenase [Helicobacter sp. MIT 21-1697]
MPKIAISVGDVNGIGLEIALRTHHQIIRFCEPLYCAHREVLESASALLDFPLPQDMQCVADFEYPRGGLIEPNCVSAKSGKYSYESFMQGVNLTQSKQCAALVTLPIHKKAWQKAGISFVGHTHALSSICGVDSIMMLGCPSLFIALFTDHIALSQVSACVTQERVKDFLLRFAQGVNLNEPCCVLGLNPHCGDEGIMGSEDKQINAAVSEVNMQLGKKIFFGAYPPDSAFSPFNREKFRYFVSMYHDVGLAPLKALYFEQSINVSLNLPILRTSVDHGVAYDKAYKKGSNISTQSYLNAVQYAANNVLR